MIIKVLPALAGDCIEILSKKTVPRFIVIDGGMGKKCKTILKDDFHKWVADNGPVDLAILTHVDNDHIDGFISLLADSSFDKNMLKEVWFNYGKRIEKNVTEMSETRLFIPERSSLTSSKQGRKFCGLLREKGIPMIAPITSGMVKEYGALRIEVISPSEKCLAEYVNSDEYSLCDKGKDEILTASRKRDYNKSVEELINKKFDENGVTKVNASSIAVLVSDERSKILCLADAKSTLIESELRRRGYNERNPLEIDCLKVSHHGSAYSTGDSLLGIIKCNNYIISTNWQGLPSKECLARIAVNSREPVTFWCNYKPESNIFSDDEYKKYGMTFKYVGNMEIEVGGE